MNPLLNVLNYPVVDILTGILPVLVRICEFCADCLDTSIMIEVNIYSILRWVT